MATVVLTETRPSRTYPPATVLLNAAMSSPSSPESRELTDPLIPGVQRLPGLTPACGLETVAARLQTPARAEFAGLVDLSSLGGIVTKGLSAQPIDGNPPPRVWETEAGMINSIGLQNIGVRAFIAEKLPALRTCGTAIFTNVFGYKFNDYLKQSGYLKMPRGSQRTSSMFPAPILRRRDLLLQRSGGAGGTGGRGAVSCQTTFDGEAVAECREDPAACRRRARGGADAISLVNTFISLAIDARARKARLGAGFGGLSGPGIKLHRAAHVLRGGTSGEDSRGGPRRHRVRHGRGRVHDCGCHGGRGRHRKLLGPGIARAHRRGVGCVSARGGVARAADLVGTLKL